MIPIHDQVIQANDYKETWTGLLEQMTIGISGQFLVSFVESLIRLLRVKTTKF